MAGGRTIKLTTVITQGRSEKCFHVAGGRSIKLTTVTTQGGVIIILLVPDEQVVHIIEWELGL
eukprot:11872589-Ditylum_brightwellii.AAC.2